ncbi:hypothetical protein [Methanosarcina horonobensis]|uniref:hypothetical protein n=1 Tax=Methanosarcina horonobensis TaxID=418008 RepID=UPI000A8EE6E8|nr:hypothetical protein [Methanosarcina horonobensis]
MTKGSNSLVKLIILVFIVISLFFYLYFMGQLLLGIIAAGIIILIAGMLLLLPSITDPLSSSYYRGDEKSESFGVESTCLGDSRVYERPSFFIGVPFIITFGGVFSKYESIFSIAYESGTTLVLYHGLCFVSKDDKLSISGKWYRGKKTRNTGRYYCCRQS